MTTKDKSHNNLLHAHEKYLLLNYFNNSGGLVFNKQDEDETVAGIFKEATTLGTLNMEVIPPRSGLAEIDLKFSQGTECTKIQVRPSTAFIRPLSLEANKRFSHGSQAITI